MRLFRFIFNPLDIPTPIYTPLPTFPRISTLIPRIHTPLTTFRRIPTLIPRIPVLIPRIPIILLIPFTDSPFRLLQISLKAFFKFLKKLNASLSLLKQVARSSTYKSHKGFFNMNFYNIFQVQLDWKWCFKVHFQRK